MNYCLTKSIIARDLICVNYKNTLTKYFNANNKTFKPI